MDNQLRRNILIQAAIALVGIFILLETSDPEAYYSDGGKATLAGFLLYEARPELFREVTALDCNTFDALVAEFRRKDLLANGQSVTVEEQVLMFLDGVVSNNSMRQTAFKYCRGLYTVQRYYFHLILSIFSCADDTVFFGSQVLPQCPGCIGGIVPQVCQFKTC